MEATIAILRGLQEKYELHHGVEITDPAIVAAAELSHRYITDRFLPDKAIDLIDEAAARIKMEIDSKPEAMDRLDRRLIQLKIEREAVKKENDEASQKRLRLIEDEIEKLEREYADLEEIWKAEKAQVQGSAHIKEEIERLKPRSRAASAKASWTKWRSCNTASLPQLEAQMKQAEQRRSPAAPTRLLRTQVGAEEIAEVVSRATGIPVSKMMQGEREKLLQMEDALHERVVGQDEAVALVSRCDSPLSAPVSAIRSGRTARSCFWGRPASVRPSCARRSRSSCSTREDHLIRIDMSEFMEKHSVARLDRRAARLCRLRGRRLSDRSCAAQALLGDSARRNREGAPRRLQRAAAGARRRPHDRRSGPHGRLQEHRHRDDVEPGLAHDPADGGRANTRRSSSR